MLLLLCFFFLLSLFHFSLTRFIRLFQVYASSAGDCWCISLVAVVASNCLSCVCFFFASAQYKRGRNRGKNIVTARTYHLNDTRHLTGWRSYDFFSSCVHVRAICVWFKLEHVLHIIHFYFFFSLRRNKTKEQMREREREK